MDHYRDHPMTHQFEDVAEDILRYLDEYADRLPQSSSKTLDGKHIYFSGRTPSALRNRLRSALNNHYAAEAPP